MWLKDSQHSPSVDFYLVPGFLFGSRCFVGVLEPTQKGIQNVDFSSIYAQYVLVRIPAIGGLEHLIWMVFHYVELKVRIIFRIMFIVF